MTATRRLAAILAADVAGYSRLMGGERGGDGVRGRADNADVSGSLQLPRSRSV
jgi:hypothetical protein